MISLLISLGLLAPKTTPCTLTVVNQYTGMARFVTYCQGDSMVKVYNANSCHCEKK